MDEVEYSAKIHLLLGRLDGKMDMVLNHQTLQVERLEALEKRVSTNENRLTTLETDKDNNKSSRTVYLSIAAIVISSVNAVKGFFRFN